MEISKTGIPTLRLSIASTFTCDPIQPSFKLWGSKFGFQTDVHFSPYDQVFQELLSQSSALNHPENDARLVFLKFDDWTRNLSNPDNSERHSHIIASIQSFCEYASSAASLAKSPLFVTIARNSEKSHINPEQQAAYEKIIKDNLSEHTNIFVTTTGDTDLKYSVEDYYDSQRDQLGHIPFKAEYFSALATSVFRKVLASKRKPYKVIVLDCDNTLWGGVCGEEGPEGISLSEPYLKLQSFMLEQVTSGKILCLCSKNVPEDVQRVFNERPDMIIKEEHIVGSKINWKPKFKNIQDLADELNLGLDSFIFVDDNPVECAEVRVSCPEVLTLNLPAEPGKIPGFLDHAWAFDFLRSTSEDQQRTKLYKDNLKRSDYRNASSSMKDFIEGLNIDIQIADAGPDELNRVSQLTYRTNQFNFTTIRRSEEEIKNLLGRDGFSCKVCRVKDRFGDYGLVGVMLYQSLSDRVVLDSFMLSCRVLGRGVEHQMLNSVGEAAQEQGIPTVQINFESTDKNQPALNFLKSVFSEFDGGSYPPESGYTATSSFLAELRYAPDMGGQSEIEPEEKEGGSAKGIIENQNSIIFEEIARDLNTVLKITQQIPQNGLRVAGNKPVSVKKEDRTPASIITDIWESILDRKGIGPHQHFFDVGGTSLKAVEVLSRLNEEFNKNLTIVSLFEHSTIHSLAKLVGSAPVGNTQFNKILERAASRRDRLRR